ncbi:MAG: hypothetical protein R2741_14045 [Methanolobus sp.]
MKLPASIKHALIEAKISLYTENHPSSKVNGEPLTFSIPTDNILEMTKPFGITVSDIQTSVTENPGSLIINEDEAVIFTPPFTRKCDKYDDCLNYIKENTSSNSKFTIEYDPAIKESLIYHFFSGSIVLMVPEGMQSLQQLKFALMAGGSKLRAIIDKTGGWIYIFPKFIMESMECGKMPAIDTNVDEVIGSYLEDMFPE